MPNACHSTERPIYKVASQQLCYRYDMLVRQLHHTSKASGVSTNEVVEIECCTLRVSLHITYTEGHSVPLAWRSQALGVLCHVVGTEALCSNSP
jgi:hypothetical protein